MLCIAILFSFSCSDGDPIEPEELIESEEDSIYCSFKYNGQEYYFNFRSQIGLQFLSDSILTGDSAVIGLGTGFSKQEDLLPAGEIIIVISKKFKKSELQNEKKPDKIYVPSRSELDQILMVGEKKYRIDKPFKYIFSEHIDIEFRKEPALEDTTSFFATSSRFWMDSTAFEQIPDPQEGSYFNILSVELIDSNRYARVTGEFRARVYSWKGECYVLENGKFCADFWYEQYFKENYN